MGRYRAQRVIVREIGGMEIIFWDGFSIYVITPYIAYVFQRWYAPKGSYDTWRKFRHLMMHRKHLTFDIACRLAARYGILGQRSGAKLNWKNKPVEVRFGNIKIIGVHDDMHDVPRTQRVAQEIN